MTRDQSIALMLRLEGGEANLAGDPGGHTKYGITQRTLDAVRASDPVWAFPANVADLTTDAAVVIYQRVYWDGIAGDDLPASLACIMLNAAVNMGEPTAIRILHDCLGLTGTIIGKQTLDAIAVWASPYQPDQTLVQEFAARVAVRYAQLNAHEYQFELGWFRRLFLVYTLATNPKIA